MIERANAIAAQIWERIKAKGETMADDASLCVTVCVTEMPEYFGIERNTVFRKTGEIFTSSLEARVSKRSGHWELPSVGADGKSRWLDMGPVRVQGGNE